MERSRTPHPQHNDPAPNEAPAPALTNVHRERSALVQGFLWILLAVVALTFVLNAILLGERILAPQAFAPNLGFAALIGLALWLNAHARFRAAVWLVNLVMLLASSATVLAEGFASGGVGLLLFFLPLTLAGLLLDRPALLVSAVWAGAVVLATPILHGAPAQAETVVAPSTVALQFALVVIALTAFLDRFGLRFQRTLQDAVTHEAALAHETQARLDTNRALLEERRFSDTIIENLPGVLFVLGENGTYFQWNRNFVDAFGYEEGEVAQLHPLDLFEGQDRDLVAKRIQDVFEHGRSSVEAHVVTKDGRRIPYLLLGTRVELGGRTYLAGIGLDRSELDAAHGRIRALNDDLRERLERLTALREIDRAITEGLDLNATLAVILEQACNRLHVDGAGILLYRPASGTLRHAAAQGLPPELSSPKDLRLGEELAGRAGLTLERVAIDDPVELVRQIGTLDPSTPPRFHAYRAIPLVANGQLQGVLELFHGRSLEALDDDDHDFAGALAMQAAIALHDASLYENLERSNQELRVAYDTTIEGWAQALDLKDEETVGHSRRVTELTVDLARHMGMDEAHLVHVRRGALLHDIGKMGVPDDILRKPGKLTDEEWRIMKRHTSYAQELLSPIAFLRPALDIPYAHHEKWDGSGYPRGLAGEDIPQAARIFAVVDVYDALTSDRPYRKAWTEDDALAHVREQAGHHFDPSVVDAFLELLAARPSEPDARA